MQPNYLLSIILSGLAIGGIAVIVSIPWSMKEKIARMEARSRERLAMIEKGIDPDKFLRDKRSIGQDPLFWGLLLAGMGLGIFLGYAISRIIGWDKNILINAMAILLGGLALILYPKYRTKPEDQRPS